MEICSDEDTKKNYEENPNSNITPFLLSDFCIGDVLNYGRVLDNGQQTQVRICMHAISKTFFCIKMEPFLNEEHKGELLKKSNMQKIASHPSIVKLYCTFHDDKFVYHIMEYLPGGDLFEMVTTIGALPESMAKRYISQLILAVEFLHSHHILHNDIKLENLLLNNVETVKLTDFGLASYETDERPVAINGTPEYMSPEIILRKPHGRGADWWSVGICIFEMLTGHLPFDMNDSDSTMVTFKKILQSELVIPDTINPLAADLILQLLTVDNHKRLGSGEHGSNDIKNHKWFSDIEWNSVIKSDIDGIHFVRKLHEN